MGNQCSGTIVPVADDTDHIHKFIYDNANAVVYSLGKTRYSLLNSESLGTIAIDAEGLIDFALISLHGTVIDNVRGFARHRRFCCALLNHSATVITRLYDAVSQPSIHDECHHNKKPMYSNPVSSQKAWGKEPTSTTTFYEQRINSTHKPISEMEEELADIVEWAKAVLNHPLLSWDAVVTGTDHGEDTTAQLFCIFHGYCYALIGVLRNSALLSELPPQTYFRVVCQAYDTRNMSSIPHALEYEKISSVLDEVMNMCEPIIRERSAARSGHRTPTQTTLGNQYSEDIAKPVTNTVPPAQFYKQERRFSSTLSPVAE